MRKMSLILINVNLKYQSFLLRLKNRVQAAQAVQVVRDAKERRVRLSEYSGFLIIKV